MASISAFPRVLGYDYGFLAEFREKVPLIGSARDESVAPATSLLTSPSSRRAPPAFPRAPSLRVLDADHFLADALDELAASCREASAWADPASDR